MKTALAILLGAAVFGAGDQYLGSLSGSHGIPWAAQVSLLSAPWLLLPFLAGSTQRDSKRAALLGLAATFLALAGYAMMTLSPLEHAHLSLTGLAGFARSNHRNIAGGLITGPLFAWLGNRWRVARAGWAAFVMAAMFCVEPLARIPLGSPITSRDVGLGEVAGGLAIATYFLLATVVRRRSADRHTTR
jgi:hypothetical protein